MGFGLLYYHHLCTPGGGGGVSHHMHDSGESDNSSVCHTSYHQQDKSVHMLVTLNVGPSYIMTSQSVCLSHQSSDHHTNIMTSPSICQSNIPSDHHTNILTSPSICQTHILLEAPKSLFLMCTMEISQKLKYKFLLLILLYLLYY